MNEHAMPKETMGSWIWIPEQFQRKHCRSIFARKEFVLPAFAQVSELWISALPGYHVFINGEHVGYGPAAATEKHCYVDFYDISQYLDSGTNTVAVIASAGFSAACEGVPHPPKFWCQINVDDTPVVWSSGEWKLNCIASYAGGRPRCHGGLEYVEEADLPSLPKGWTFNGFDDSQWIPAYEIVPALEGRPSPVPLGLPSSFWMESNAFEPWQSGSVTESRGFLFYSYGNFPEFQKGTYAAQTYLYSRNERETTMQISSDDPAVVFCNEEPVYFCEQRIGLNQFDSPTNPQVGKEILARCTIHLKQGWNRILSVQECLEDSMGMMLLFPELSAGTVVSCREPSDEALPGWKIAGPLKMPLNYATASLSIDGLPVTEFLPHRENINDVSAYLSNCLFTQQELPGSCLHTGNYVIYDLSEFRYGFPILDISGSEGDIIDISCGLRLNDGAVRTIGPLGRMTDTIRLSEGDNNWMRLAPRGARYVMLTVRKAANTVRPVFRFSYEYSELGDRTEFTSSDDTFNFIWEKALHAIRLCSIQNLIDDPCGKRTQALPETFLYSNLLYLLSNGFPCAEKALREFAEGQFENGMFQRLSPSGSFSYAPDCSLLWVLWLESFYKASGNLTFLREMEKHLTHLLKFFSLLAENEEGVLTVEKAGTSFFLNEKHLLAERGVFLPLNALYCRALLCAQSIYADLNMKEQSHLCRNHALKISGVLCEKMLNSSSGLFADSWSDGKPSHRHSLFSNLLALYSGIAPEESAQAILDLCSSGEEQILEFASTPMFYFVLETLFAYGQHEFAFDLIRKAAGNCSEEEPLYRPHYNPHIFWILSAVYLVRELLGVRNAVPGARNIYLMPGCFHAEKVRGKLPRGIGGRMLVEWSRAEKNLIVSVDSSTELDVLPQIAPGMEATFNLGMHVGLLGPADSAQK